MNTHHFYLQTSKSSFCLLTGFPADLDNPRESPALGVLPRRGDGHSLMDRLMPLCSPVLSRLNCDAEFTRFFVTLKRY